MDPTKLREYPKIWQQLLTGGKRRYERFLVLEDPFPEKEKALDAANAALVHVLKEHNGGVEKGEFVYFSKPLLC
jgi:hypothetical protein